MQGDCLVIYFNIIISNQIFEYRQPATNGFNNNSLYNAHELPMCPK